jgi:hypothetical protein
MGDISIRIDGINCPNDFRVLFKPQTTPGTSVPVSPPATQTPTPTPTVTQTPGASQSPTPTVTPTVTPSETVTPTPTVTPSISPPIPELLVFFDDTGSLIITGITTHELTINYTVYGYAEAYSGTGGIARASSMSMKLYKDAAVVDDEATSASVLAEGGGPNSNFSTDSLVYTYSVSSTTNIYAEGDGYCAANVPDDYMDSRGHVIINTATISNAVPGNVTIDTNKNKFVYRHTDAPNGDCTVINESIPA